MSVGQLGLSALATAGFWSLAVLLAVFGIFELLEAGVGSPSATGQFLLSASMGLLGLVCLPSAWAAGKRLLNKPPSTTHKVYLLPRNWDTYHLVSIMMITLLPLSLAVGSLATKNEWLSWLVLPPLNLLATGLPVLWLALLGIRKLPGGSAQRRWGLLTCGLAYTTPVILLAEILLIVVGGVLVLAWLSTQPEQYNKLLELFQQLRSMTTLDQEAFLRLVEPYFNQPFVMVGLVVTAALIIPLIEEMLKPLGVWLLAWKKLSPAQGWVAGVISGAAFALFENLGNTSGGGEEWVLVSVSRISAALLHMVTSGLMGWAIAAAWTERRYLRLFGIYAASVTIHGLWNGLAILGSVALPFDLPADASTALPFKGIVALFGLIILGVFNLFLYVKMNHSLRPKTEAQSSELVVF